MKTICLSIVATLLLVGPSFGNEQVTSHEPEMSLFQSVERIKEYLKSEAKQDYSDKYLHSVKYHYSEGHPRKGAYAGFSPSRSRSQDSVATSASTISWTERSLNFITDHKRPRTRPFSLSETSGGFPHADGCR